MVQSKDRTKHKGECGVGLVFGPYAAEVTVVGISDLLMHRWDTEEVESKGKAPKNSATKKTDNVESYLYRMKDGTVGIPPANFKAAICDAAKFLQDPRSPRKCARDLFRAAVTVSEGGSLGVKTWDYLDKRRAVVQRNAVSRTRPAFLAGWKATFIVQVTAADLISVDFLSDAVTRAGQFVGMCDYHPEFGRFRIESFRVLD